jgi:hypothetical protein
LDDGIFAVLIVEILQIHLSNNFSPFSYFFWHRVIFERSLGDSERWICGVDGRGDVFDCGKQPADADVIDMKFNVWMVRLNPPVVAEADPVERR